MNSAANEHEWARMKAGERKTNGSGKRFAAIRVHSRLKFFFLTLAPLILATAFAFAHDPGLSAADVKLDGNKAVARLTFARNEIATIAPMDADHDGRITQPEFDAARG